LHSITLRSKSGSAWEWRRGAADYLQIPEEAKTFLESADMSGAQQNVEALNLPLSLGETKHENDKQGEPCTVYDVVFNDEALKQAKAFR